LLLAISINAYCKYNSNIDFYAKKHGVDSLIVHAIIQVESQYTVRCSRYEKELVTQKWYSDWIENKYSNNMLAYSSVGIMQILYGTALWLGYRGTPKGLYNLNDNLNYGVKYIAYLFKKYNGNVRHVAASYNAGKVRKKRNGTYLNNKYVLKFNSIYVRMLVDRKLKRTVNKAKKDNIFTKMYKRIAWHVDRTRNNYW
jgi:soluble lytic murein transglycosylase-like protein